MKDEFVENSQKIPFKKYSWPEFPVQIFNLDH